MTWLRDIFIHVNLGVINSISPQNRCDLEPVYILFCVWYKHLFEFLIPINFPWLELTSINYFWELLYHHSKNLYHQNVLNHLNYIWCVCTVLQIQLIYNFHFINMQWGKFSAKIKFGCDALTYSELHLINCHVFLLVWPSYI